MLIMLGWWSMVIISDSRFFLVGCSCGKSDWLPQRAFLFFIFRTGISVIAILHFGIPDLENWSSTVYVLLNKLPELRSDWNNACFPPFFFSLPILHWKVLLMISYNKQVSGSLVIWCLDVLTILVYVMLKVQVGLFQHTITFTKKFGAMVLKNSLF